MAATRRKSASVTLGVTSLLAVALTAACSPQRAGGRTSGDGDADYGAVCADPQTHKRLADDECNGNPGHRSRGGWYFIPAGRPYAANGQTVSDGSFTRPSDGSTVKYGGLSPNGGSVSRGGFGGNTGRSGS